MKKSRPRHGSLQFYPRKRAANLTPSVNWKHISAQNPGLLGFLTYKVGMATALVRDNTDKIMTAKKQLAIPVTILEVPAMKIYSIRFYKHGQVVKENIAANDKELKHKVKVSHAIHPVSHPEDFDDVRVILFSIMKQTAIKKTPDFVEVAVQGANAHAKLEYVKSLVGKELTLEHFSHGSLVDVRAVTRGRGIQGPVKRFGITLRQHKSEKGIRKVGSIGPWHPAHVTFRIPAAGQMGLHTRVHYNIKVLGKGNIGEKNINPASGFKNYGLIKNSYLVVSGSIQGPTKRQVLLTPSYRPTKEQAKRKLELLEVYTK